MYVYEDTLGLGTSTTLDCFTFVRDRCGSFGKWL